MQPASVRQRGIRPTGLAGELDGLTVDAAGLLPMMEWRQAAAGLCSMNFPHNSGHVRSLARASLGGAWIAAPAVLGQPMLCPCAGLLNGMFAYSPKAGLRRSPVLVRYWSHGEMKTVHHPKEGVCVCHRTVILNAGVQVGEVRKASGSSDAR